MTHILMIEDDLLIQKPVVQALEKNGFQVTCARDGKNGLDHALEDGPDLVLLDIMLPVMDGWEVCKKIRQHSTVPILMLTALGEEVDRVLGLELGADDYITKPFSTRVLLARIKAMLRRVILDGGKGTQTFTNTITIGNITLNPRSRRVFKGESELHLRYKEFELLTLLMASAGEVVTRAEIFNRVWGTDWLGDMRTLDVHIRWLREKLDDDPHLPRYIETVRGAGYRFINEEGTP